MIKNYNINDYLKDDKELQKAVIDEFLKETTELKAENEALIEGLGVANKYVNNYHQTLQEIKKYIAKICKEECGYVKKKRCPDCDCRFGAILDLITKEEEE